MKTTGFIPSLEFLKKSSNLQTSFPDLKNICKVKIKSESGGKSVILSFFENQNGKRSAAFLSIGLLEQNTAYLKLIFCPTQ